MDRQEIFDKVSNHLIKQGCRAINSRSMACLYRDSKGRSCAVGCLIPDELYTKQMDRLHNIPTGIIYNTVVQNVLSGIGIEMSESNLYFLRQLQILHDTEGNWIGEGIKYHLVEFAKSNNLQCSF